MSKYRVAQVNIGRMKGSLESPVMAGFVARLGHTPGVDEAKKRLAHLEQHGPSQFAFGFKSILPPDPAYIDTFDWSTFEPCRAA